MFTDLKRHEVYEQLREHDLRVFAKFLDGGVFLEAARRSKVCLRSCPLNCVNLVWLGISAALRKTESFVTILTITLKLLQDQEHFDNTQFGKDLKDKDRQQKKSKKKNKHDPHGQSNQEVTEEAFAKARMRMPIGFWVALILVLVERFEAKHAKRMRFRGFRLLAIDGTRLTLPDEKALRDFYGSASNAQGNHNAQARMVLLQSPLTRLPVAYQLEPLKVGEVTMARELTRGLRPEDLVLIDSGYKSYGLLWDIQHRGAFFCLRLQGAMNLKPLPRRGRNRRERWVRWTPTDSRGQWRKEGLPRAIDLRMVEYKVPGFRNIRLITNVLDPKRLSYDDFSRLTTTAGAAEKLLPGLYHMRWQIETSFSELKIVHQMEGGLRSRKPKGIAYEIAGHVVLYLLVRWLIMEAAVAHNVEPLQISFTSALRELREIWNTLVASSPEWVAQVLLPRLLQRMASHRVPYRPGRSYPRKRKAKGKTAKSKRRKS